MLKDNLVTLRNLYGFSQEEIAGKIDISRQARLIVLSDDDGIALVEVEKFEENLRRMMELASKIN